MPQSYLGMIACLTSTVKKYCLAAQHGFMRLIHRQAHSLTIKNPVPTGGTGFLLHTLQGTGSGAFDRQGNAHAAADAQSGKALLGLGTLLHLVEQGNNDTSA